MDKIKQKSPNHEAETCNNSCKKEFEFYYYFTLYRHTKCKIS